MRSVVCFLSLLMPFAFGSPVRVVDNQNISRLDVPRLDGNVVRFVATPSTMASVTAQPAAFRIEEALPSSSASSVAAPSLTISMGTVFAGQQDLRHVPPLPRDTSLEKMFQLPALSDEKLFNYLALPESSPTIVSADPAGQAPQFLDTIDSMLSPPVPTTDFMSLHESIPQEAQGNQYSPW